MVKRHLKRIAAPKSWPIKRKDNIFVMRPNPGAHSINYGIPINFILTEMLNYTQTSAETKKLLYKNKVFVNKKQVKNPKFMLGLFDILALSEKEQYRLLINTKGKFYLIKIDYEQSSLFPFKVRSKKALKGGVMQLNLTGGRNLRAEKDDYKIGDTVLLQLPEKKVMQHLSLEKGNLVYLTSGAHAGKLGKVEQINSDKLTFKPVDDQTRMYETLKEYAFVMGKDKSLITLENVKENENHGKTEKD